MNDIGIHRILLVCYSGILLVAICMGHFIGILIGTQIVTISGSVLLYQDLYTDHVKGVLKSVFMVALAFTLFLWIFVTHTNAMASLTLVYFGYSVLLKDRTEN